MGFARIADVWELWRNPVRQQLLIHSLDQAGIRPLDGLGRKGPSGTPSFFIQRGLWLYNLLVANVFAFVFHSTGACVNWLSNCSTFFASFGAASAMLLVVGRRSYEHQRDQKCRSVAPSAAPVCSKQSRYNVESTSLPLCAEINPSPFLQRWVLSLVVNIDASATAALAVSVAHFVKNNWMPRFVSLLSRAVIAASPSSKTNLFDDV